ncbi:MAG: hypothetical protein GY719_02375 [bacterium]|nr:hypothetical protein [bacterium]
MTYPLADMTCVVGTIDGRAIILGADSAGVEPAQRRLQLALETAAIYTATVRPPWHFVRGGS